MPGRKHPAALLMSAGASRVERRAWGVALLVETGSILASSLDLATTMHHVAQLTVPDLADLCVIDVCDNTGSIGELAVASADPRLAGRLEALRSSFPLDPEGQHPVPRVIRSGRAELIPELGPDALRLLALSPEHERFMIESGYRSAIVAPLAARERVLGALTTFRLADAEPYDEEDLALVSELARRAALAIDNARLFAATQRVEQRLEAVLRNLAEAITVVDDQGRTVFANRAALDLLGLQSQEELTRARPGEIMERFLVLDESGRELELDAMPARRLFRGEEAQPLLVRNIVRATGEERWLVVRASPIVDPDTGRVAYAANVFENVTEVKRAQLAEAFMAQASRVLASSMDYSETLQAVARLAATHLADWCAVDVLGERGELERVAVHHLDPDMLALAVRLDRDYRPSLEDEFGVPEVIRTGKARIFNDITAEALATFARDEEHLRLLRSMGARDVIIVPLAAPARTLGAITLVSSQRGRRLVEADLDVATRLGRRAGTAVESARLYTARSRIARVLQRALLPDSLPDMPGFEVAASYRPAGELNDVGGDFYDVISCGEREWILVIGDVCGKGPEAASMTALARHTLRAVSMLEARPAAMLELLHRTLCEQPEGQMCTVCVVLVRDTSDGVTLTVALGGHPCPLLVGPGEEARSVGEPGTVLGMVDPITVSETSVPLNAQQTLILFTDGVTEAARSDLLDAPALAELAARSAQLPVPEMLELIERAAVASAGGHPRDDIALLAIRLAPGPRS
jgi:PAS domain S-box-containing protein